MRWKLPAVPAGARTEWPAFSELLSGLHQASAWAGQVGMVRQWYEPHLERLYDAPHLRTADLEQLEQLASGHPTREGFLTDLTLDPPGGMGDEAGDPLLDDDYLILSTIHSAKGQEWDAVYVLHVVDGCIPSDMATGTPEEIEEERRLLYVAMTRARDALYLLQPHRFYTQGRPNGDEHVYAPRTRFIPASVAPLFERAADPVAVSPDPTGSGPVARADVQQRLREMWR
jgi:DNA helicase-2/ATP-dependent DNA helicase PcrA